MATISTAGKVDIGALEIDGATDIGAGLADADLIIVDDGANGTERKCAVSRIGTYIGAATLTLTNKTLTSPVLTTPQINDTSSDHQYVFVASELAADRNVTLPLLPGNDEFTFNAMTQTLTNKTLTSPVLTTPTLTTSVQASADAADVVLNQYDGHEVARIHDGATAATIETGTLDMTAGAAGKGGFGFKRAVYNVTPGTDDQAVTLAAKHSGCVIMVTGAGYDLDITLPVILAGEEGWHCTIVVTTAFSGTNNLEIGTAGAGTDNNDTIHLYTQVATAVTVDAAGDTVISAADIPAGTMFELLAVKGGAAEQWICKAYQISGTAPTTGTAPA